MERLRLAILVLHVWIGKPHRRHQVEDLVRELYAAQHHHQRRRWRIEDAQPAVVLGGM
jgi:hypothetical protein